LTSILELATILWQAHRAFIFYMAKTSTANRRDKKLKFDVRFKNRCFRCKRARGYMRKFGLCRICFRELARDGKIPGVRKAS